MQLGKNVLDNGMHVYVGKNRSGLYFTFDALGNGKKFYITACPHKPGYWRYVIKGNRQESQIEKVR